MLFLACVLLLSTVGDETRAKRFLALHLIIAGALLLALCFLHIVNEKQKESIVTIGVFLAETGIDLYGDD